MAIRSGMLRQREMGTRMEDEIDRRLIAGKWREATEPQERRAWRYDTMKLAAFGWLYVDQFREWSRHRNG